MPVQLDEKDMKIIEILMSNARSSYSEIAKVLGVSDVAIIKRVRKLEQQGIIKKYTILVDPKKLGYEAVSITGVDVNPEYLFKTVSILKEKDYVKYLALTSGDHQIIATIWAKTRDELAQILDEISKMPGVKRVCPAVILDVVKE
ncbi:Lrp/AsnC family transcriptional regulator [Desulfurococcaceae archaeon MEX13E-LK6-19]|nr:Lrp/AsnC family transcriptional regulator [Desulfurococcaceae archaeon MEX13E-LK6-19]